MPDYTQDYIARGIGGITNALKDAMDPRTQIALQAARRDAELHPFRQQKLQADIGLSGARALTEGQQAALYQAQAGDQAMRTRFRGILGGEAVPQYLPDVAPLIDNATANFNAAAQSYPGAAAHLGLNLAAPTPVPGAMAAGGYEQPNALLPPPNGPAPSPSNYNFQDMARIITAIQENPNPATAMEAFAKAQALSSSGPLNEDDMRRSLVAQGKMPTINTAVSPQLQGSLLEDKYANAVAINDADNAALMERTGVQQAEANKRVLLGTAAKAMLGTPAKSMSYTDQRNLRQDAGGVADQFFGISRDDAGNPLGNQLSPAVIAQRDQLARRTAGYMAVNGGDIIGARDRAAIDLFGSAQRSDPNAFNQPQSGWLVRDQPFSAKTVNSNALDSVERTGSPDLNGASPAAAALMNQLLGIGPPKDAPVTTAVPAAQAPAPIPPSPFALKPTRAEVEQRKVNQAKVAELKGRVAQIEDNLKSGKMSVPTMNPYGFSAGVNKFVDLAGNNDAFNQQAQLRLSLLQEIAKLEGSTGNATSTDDIERRYAP